MASEIYSGSLRVNFVTRRRWVISLTARLRCSRQRSPSNH